MEGQDYVEDNPVEEGSLAVEDNLAGEGIQAVEGNLVVVDNLAGEGNPVGVGIQVEVDIRVGVDSLGLGDLAELGADQAGLAESVAVQVALGMVDTVGSLVGDIHMGKVGNLVDIRMEGRGDNLAVVDLVGQEVLVDPA